MHPRKASFVSLLALVLIVCFVGSSEAFPGKKRLTFNLYQHTSSQNGKECFLFRNRFVFPCHKHIKNPPRSTRVYFF